MDVNLTLLPTVIGDEPEFYLWVPHVSIFIDAAHFLLPLTGRASCSSVPPTSAPTLHARHSHRRSCSPSPRHAASGHALLAPHPSYDATRGGSHTQHHSRAATSRYARSPSATLSRCFANFARPAGCIHPSAVLALPPYTTPRISSRRHVPARIPRRTT